MILSTLNPLLIVCNELSDFNYSVPDGYSNSIVNQVNILLHVGGVSVSANAPFLNDWIDGSIGHQNEQGV